MINCGIARLEEVRDANGTLTNLYVRVRRVVAIIGFMINPATQVDRELVLTKGRDAVGKLLVDLQVRKSTADSIGARDFYLKLTKPISGWEGEIRDIVLKKKLVSITVFLAWALLTCFISPARSLSSQTLS